MEMTIMTQEKIKRLDKEATVCFLSADLQFLIKQLKKKLSSAEDKQQLTLISEKARLIQRKAQKMENRLKKYRNAIEGLGFIRKG